MDEWLNAPPRYLAGRRCEVAEVPMAVCGRPGLYVPPHHWASAAASSRGLAHTKPAEFIAIITPSVVPFSTTWYFTTECQVAEKVLLVGGGGWRCPAQGTGLSSRVGPRRRKRRRVGRAAGAGDALCARRRETAGALPAHRAGPRLPRFALPFLPSQDSPEPAGPGVPGRRFSFPAGFCLPAGRERGRTWLRSYPGQRSAEEEPGLRDQDSGSAPLLGIGSCGRRVELRPALDHRRGSPLRGPAGLRTRAAWRGCSWPLQWVRVGRLPSPSRCGIPRRKKCSQVKLPHSCGMKKQHDAQKHRSPL
ncbi:uncharacterized protein LOC135186930 [Pogoniulus pusillus]|uniref:uncharacterized protein LOC135186930 n=1 Tax=Pogoniulus pusillus TaxID=488313 RepID=UPI0030B98E48